MDVSLLFLRVPSIDLSVNEYCTSISVENFIRYSSAESGGIIPVGQQVEILNEPPRAQCTHLR